MVRFYGVGLGSRSIIRVYDLSLGLGLGFEALDSLMH